MVAISLFLFSSASVAGAQEQIKLQALSDQGTFMVEIVWIPDDIGRDNTFRVRFIEPETEIEIEDIEYTLLVFYGESSNPVLSRVDQISTVQAVKFEEPGPYTIRFDDIDGLGEGASFPIRVTPEFPSGVLWLAAVASGLVLILARRYRNTLFTRGSNNCHWPAHTRWHS